MPINSKQKGKRGEREFAAFLREHGFDARRGQQYKGGSDSADVICEQLAGVHFEVKFSERLNIYDALEQAMNDAGGKLPIVAHRKNRGEWLAILPMQQLLKMMQS